MNGFKPYKRHPDHADIALLHFDNGEIWFELEPFPYRCLSVTDVPNSCVIYGERDTIKALLRQGLGEATYKDAGIMRWDWEGRTIIPLPRDVEVTFADLCLWREWLESEGAGIGSRSGSAMKLLRATLQKEFSYSGARPPIEEIVGGRLHTTPPRMHPKIDVWDLRSAYATTLASLPSGVWQTRKFEIENADNVGFVLATVYVSGRGSWGPLPQREGMRTTGQWWEEWIIERPYPQRVTITGIWSADEIRSALKHGARVEKIHHSWFLRVEDYPFLPWWEAVERGRKMPDAAGALAKITGNTLWGVFGTRDAPLYKLRYVDGQKIKTVLPSQPLFNRNYPLAELITSKVRSRVYDELIMPAGKALISVCVDGGLVEPGFVPPNDDWRLKDSGTLCGFLKPYLYMYVRTFDKTPVYKAAGVPTSQRRSFFESLQRHAQQHGRVALKMRHAFDGSGLEVALATEAVEEAFK